MNQKFVNPCRLVASSLAAIASLFFASSAFAAPSTIAVCTQVVDNADTNTNEGGAWSYSLANQSASFPTHPATTRDESQSAAAPACATPLPPLSGTASLTVLQSGSRPANWLRDAPGYPQWTISDGTHSFSGSGVASIDATEYAQLLGPTSITFSNASGRQVSKICNALLDNAAAPAGQSATFALTAIGATTSLTATEGGAAACDSSFVASIPVASQTINLSDAVSSALVEAAGFPTVQGVDAASTTVNAGLNFSGTASAYVAALNLAGTRGDITLNFSNKILATRSLTVCKTLDAAADGIDRSGPNTVETDPTGGAVGILSVTGSTVCTDANAVPSTATTTPVREVTLPGSFQGFEVGYPKWNIFLASDTARTNSILSGFGTVADIDWSAPLLQGATGAQVVFTDKAGSFTNGSQPNTGVLTRVCKLILDNADGITQSGNFKIYGQLNSGIAPFATGSTGSLSEGGLACPVSLARWPGVNSGIFSETYVSAGWPGDASGYPKLNVYNTVATPNASTAPDSSVQMGFSSSSLSSSYIATQPLPPTGNSTAVLVNKAGTAVTSTPTIQFCVRVDPNTLGHGDGGAWAFFAPIMGSVTAVEGQPEQCLAPAALPDPNSVWSQPTYTQTVTVPASWPGFDVYSPATPVAASPYVSYTSSAGNAIQDASAGFTQFGAQMTWSTSQSFLQGLTGNLKVTFVARPSAHYQLCGNVLQNGDLNDDSNTFGLFYAQGSSNTGVQKTFVEGAADTCVAAIRMPDLGAMSASETVPTSWNTANNTAGYPQ